MSSFRVLHFETKHSVLVLSWWASIWWMGTQIGHWLRQMWGYFGHVLKSIKSGLACFFLPSWAKAKSYIMESLQRIEWTVFGIFITFSMPTEHLLTLRSLAHIRPTCSVTWVGPLGGLEGPIAPFSFCMLVIRLLWTQQLFFQFVEFSKSKTLLCINSFNGE